MINMTLNDGDFNQYVTLLEIQYMALALRIYSIAL